MIHKTHDHDSRGDNFSQHSTASTGTASLGTKRGTHKAIQNIALGPKQLSRLLVLFGVVYVVCLGWVITRAHGQITDAGVLEDELSI